MGLSSYKLNAFIAVTDMARAAEFYEGKLDLPVVRTDPDGSKVYASGGVESLVVYPFSGQRRSVDRDPGDLVRR